MNEELMISKFSFYISELDKLKMSICLPQLIKDIPDYAERVEEFCKQTSCSVTKAESANCGECLRLNPGQ